MAKMAKITAKIGFMSAPQSVRDTATDRYAVILYLYRNGSKNLKEINEDLPGSTEILRELEKLNVVKQEIDKSKYPQETMLSLTEKGVEIGEMLEKVEGKMEE